MYIDSTSWKESSYRDVPMGRNKQVIITGCWISDLRKQSQGYFFLQYLVKSIFIIVDGLFRERG